MKIVALILLHATVLLMPCAAAAQSEKGKDASAGGQFDAKKQLDALCTEKKEPTACDDEVRKSRSQDEAWVVLRFACEQTGWKDTSACKQFQISRGPALVYNLRTNSWTAHWEQPSYPLKFDVAGTPTLRLKSRQAPDLKIVVDEISPLTYTAVPGTPKEEDLTIITGLKSFLALAGTGIQGLVQTLTFSAAAGVSPSPAGGETKPAVKPSSQKGTPAVAPPPPSKECTVTGADVLPAAELITARQVELVKVGAAMTALQKELDRIDRARSSFIASAQNAEDGKPVLSSELVRPDVAALEATYASFATMVSAFSTATDALATCQPLLGAYAMVLGAPADGKVIAALARRVANIQGCTEAGLRDSIQENAKLLAAEIIDDPQVCTPEKLKPIIERHRDTMKPFVERLLNARQVEEKVWTAIDKVSAGRKEVIAGAAVLTRQVDRGRRHIWADTLIRSLAVTRPNPELSWNKVQSHEIIMKADSPYVKEITLARGSEEKRPYKLESAAGRLLGYGIGMIYTPLHESTFSAVTVPGTTTKVIAETKRETRAGDLAAFLTYRFLEHRPGGSRTVQPTLDFGVGLTSDRPAFFFGPGLEIRRAARIGIGWAPQRINDLDSSQTVNETIVSSNDEIKTVKRFALDNWYVSFTFALDSLPLFNK